MNADPNEVRNPRYAGATLGDLVRGLMRRKPKKETKKEQSGPPIEQESRVLFQRRSPPGSDGSPDSG